MPLLKRQVSSLGRARRRLVATVTCSRRRAQIWNGGNWCVDAGKGSKDMRAAGRLDVGCALTRLLARSGAYSGQRGYAAVIGGPIYATAEGWRGRKGRGEVGCGQGEVLFGHNARCDGGLEVAHAYNGAAGLDSGIQLLALWNRAQGWCIAVQTQF